MAAQRLTRQQRQDIALVLAGYAAGLGAMLEPGYVAPPELVDDVIASAEAVRRLIHLQLPGRAECPPETVDAEDGSARDRLSLVA